MKWYESLVLNILLTVVIAMALVNIGNNSTNAAKIADLEKQLLSLQKDLHRAEVEAELYKNVANNVLNKEWEK